MGSESYVSSTPHSSSLATPLFEEDVDLAIAFRYLKSIDKFHEWTVSVWLSPGGKSVP